MTQGTTAVCRYAKATATPVRKEAYPNKGTKVTLRVKAFFAIKDLLKKAQKNRNQLEETKDQVHIISERG